MSVVGDCFAAKPTTRTAGNGVVGFGLDRGTLATATF